MGDREQGGGALPCGCVPFSTPSPFPRLLINTTSPHLPLDAGCAGGGDTSLTLSVALEAAPPPSAATAHVVRVAGLLGGHSGLNIHEDRGNAVQLAARVAQVRPSLSLCIPHPTSSCRPPNSLPWVVVGVPVGGVLLRG